MENSGNEGSFVPVTQSGSVTVLFVAAVNSDSSDHRYDARPECWGISKLDLDSDVMYMYSDVPATHTSALQV